MAIALAVAGVCLLALDIWMTARWSGFLAPQMVLALVALGLIGAAYTLKKRA